MTIITDNSDTIARLIAENERLRLAVLTIQPYTDAIVCYASTLSEHEGNRVAKLIDDVVRDIDAARGKDE